jgi:hypothetical protein
VTLFTVAVHKADLSLVNVHLMAHLYGPAARCKPKMTIRR